MPIGLPHFEGHHVYGYAPRSRRAEPSFAGAPAPTAGVPQAPKRSKLARDLETKTPEALAKSGDLGMSHAKLTAAQFKKLRQDPMKDAHCVKNIRASRGGTHALVDATLFHRRLRKFDQAHPIASRVAAVASVAALATVIGTLCGAAVDALAHLSDRKNDNAGRLFGTLVGCVVALTHGLMLFGVPRRMEMAMRAGTFRRDDKTPPGIALQLIENASLPLAKMVERNGKSNLGVPHSDLRVQHIDTLEAVNHAIKHGVTRKEFDGHFIVTRDAPLESIPAHRMQNDVPALGLRKGDYVAPKFLSFGHLFERDFNSRWDHPTKTLDNVFSAFLNTELKLPAPSPENEKKSIQQVRGILARYFGNEKDAARFNDNLCLCLARYFGENGRSNQHVNLSSFEYRHHDEFIAMSHIFREIMPPNEAALKSWARIDEASKIAAAFTGLRPAGMHTFVRNLEDSVVRAVSSFADPNMQGQNAGMSAPMYLPMMVLGSTVTVLLLGMSASPSAPIPLPEAGDMHLKKHIEKTTNAADANQQSAAASPQIAGSQSAPLPMAPAANTSPASAFGAYLNTPQPATSLAT